LSEHQPVLWARASVRVQGVNGAPPPSAARISTLERIIAMKYFQVFIIFAALSVSSAHERVLVAYVVDGDTIIVKRGGSTEKVRLIGIDTPESKENSKAFRDAERNGSDISVIISQGKKATSFLRGIIKKGDSVSLEFDVVERDKYGRLLAYVYLGDGRFLNELIVKSGFAYVLTIPPNVKHKNKFIEAFKYAQKNKLGLWADK
jgi:micrococcal nuclease